MPSRLQGLYLHCISYILQQTKIAIETGKNVLISLLIMVRFHSYVSLSEGMEEDSISEHDSLVAAGL